MWPLGRGEIRVASWVRVAVLLAVGALSSLAETAAVKGHTQGVASSSEKETPPGWAVSDIGPVRRAGSVSFQEAATAFTIQSSGAITGHQGTYAYKRVRGDFVATCRIVSVSPKAVGAGLMVRSGTDAEARFLRNAFNGIRFGNGPSMTCRQRDGVSPWRPGDITHVQPLPCWVRIIRYRDSLASYYSGDGKEWNLMHFGGARFSPGLPEGVLVGVVSSQHDSEGLEEAVLDHFQIEQPVNLPYVTSWIGNTYGSQYYQGHVQMQIRAMCVQPGPQPLLRVTGQNEALDSSVYDLEGNLLHMYQLEHAGGEAIASDGQWIFENTGVGPKGKNRLDRFPVGLEHVGKEGSNRAVTRSALEGTMITGLAVHDGKVYVADATRERVVVLDASSLEELQTFPTPRPGGLAVGVDGHLWVVRRPGVENKGPIFEVRPTGSAQDTNPPALVLSYRLDGQPKPERTVAFAQAPDPVLPDKIAVSPVDGRLYVCDVGRNQCVWVFDREGKPAGTFGAVGGVYRAPVPGRTDAGHLYFPRAITFDSQGCRYVAMVPRTGWVGGALLRKYDPTGTKVLWERQGLEFQECADADPGTDGQDVFTQTHRYTLDFSKPPGQEATYQALTFDPFTYPDDKRNTSNGGAVNATVVRRIGGQRFLFLHEWARNGENIYRFRESSEIAIPCGRLSNHGFWIDQDGNGQVDANEVGPKLASGECWTVDANADIWSCGGKAVRCWRQEGLNAHGAPIYTQNPTETFEVPSPFTQASHVVYDAALDRLFLGGFTDARPKHNSDHGGSVGSTLAAFAGVRSAGKLDRLLWQRDVPYLPGSAGLGNEVNAFGCASYAGDSKGGYLFIGGLSERGVKKISIWAIDPATGEQVQRFLPGPEVAGYCGWFDFNNAINAIKRKDGEYILCAEDDGAQKVNMFRWRPDTRTR
jgi:hypothetical protein